MAIVVNKPLPEFEANATGGVKVTLVLYFYPKDITPGCTTEAMQFRDKYKDFVKAGAAVFGVSRDNMKSHDEFKLKLELPFELIADTEEKMCHMFGVVKNKIMYGKKVKGIERSTFLIGADGLLKEELRGTPLDVFGYTAERRGERALIGDYEKTVAGLFDTLDGGNVDLADLRAKAVKALKKAA